MLRNLEKNKSTSLKDSGGLIKYLFSRDWVSAMEKISRAGEALDSPSMPGKTEAEAATRSRCCGAYHFMVWLS